MAFFTLTATFAKAKRRDAKENAGKIMAERRAFAKAVMARIAVLAASTDDDTLKAAATYFLKNASVAYPMPHNTVRYLSGSARKDAPTLLSVVQDDTTLVYYASSLSEPLSKCPGYVPNKNLVYAFECADMRDTWVSLHLVQAVEQAYIAHLRPYDVQGTEEWHENMLACEESQCAVIGSLAGDAFVQRAQVCVDSIMRVEKARAMQRADRPLGSHFPDRNTADILLPFFQASVNKSETEYRRDLLWRVICFGMIDRIYPKTEDRHEAKRSFDKSARAAMSKKKKLAQH